jgi:hypothetical protein
MLMTLQTRWRQFQNIPQIDYLEYFTEQEKAYLEQHIQTFAQHQIENLQKTLDLQDIPPSEFQWKEQYTNALRWCSEFHVASQKPKGLTLNS